MNKFDFSARRLMIARRAEKPKCVHKKWVDFPSGAKALLTDLSLALQLAVLAFLYAFFAYYFSPFFYVSIGLTVIAAAHVFVCERDMQSKSSWLFLFIVSFGCGYIVYILADKRVCYGYDKRRFAAIAERYSPVVPAYSAEGASGAVLNDCEYMYNAGGFVPYTGTDVRYYKSAREFFDTVIAAIEEAQSFIFLEFFIVAEGVLLERLIEVLKRKVSEGVRVKFLYDDCGCQGVLTAESKKRIKDAGVDLRRFARMFSLFSFGLNYRDHRKIIVIDGKTGFACGCNIADECTNERKMEGLWKDTGIQLVGAAVDGLSTIFLRQWEFSTRTKEDFSEYFGKYERTDNKSLVVPYAGGPEIEETICRGVYANVISGAREKLYIMTPYLIPDGDMFAQLQAKARAGVDVRIILPAVPDYPFIYRVTQSNAERLMRSGVKIYYKSRTFVHSKVMLTENCLTVGSVNMDMRAFYLEFDNGVYTDDPSAMAEAESDFNGIFSSEEVQSPAKHNVFGRLVNAVLRLVSPLM